MSRLPPYENETQARDVRLDPYRERAGILTSAGDRDATLFLRMETWWTQTSGHLWWRQWSEPYEVPHGYMMLVDGGFDDWLVGRDLLDDELSDWSQNKLRYVGEILDVNGSTTRLLVTYAIMCSDLIRRSTARVRHLPTVQPIEG
jgi:hypothetical protein